MQTSANTTERSRGIPKAGVSWNEIDADLKQFECRDAKWRDNRVFGIYFPVSSELNEVIEKASARFFRLSTHHPEVFPSASVLEQEVVGMCAGLFGSKEAFGNVTSGGTESIMLAARAARDMAQRARTISTPEMIVPRTAYPAFAKAASYLGMRLVRIGINDDYTVDLTELERAITRNTVFIAGSVPTITHGAIDPIEAMAALAQKSGIWMHVDASLGGFQLPFLKALGASVPSFDLGVPGVTSFSADIHKYAYSAMGASVLLHQSKDTYEYQRFVLKDWVGSTYQSPGVLGSRSVGPIAAAWAVMRYLGEDGYLEATRRLRRTCERFIKGINEIPGFQVLGKPITGVIAYTSGQIDMKAVCRSMESRGWSARPQIDPPSTRLLVAPGHDEIVEMYLDDLNSVASQLLTERSRSAA